MNTERLIIDGSAGEGGGQVLRACLSLSALTGRPFELHAIRGGRSRPGLGPQHLTAVRAAAAICAADLRGAALSSQFLSFTPGAPPQPGSYRFDVRDAAGGGSAGAVTLIFQTLLWPLLFAAGPSNLALLGGTHAPKSPSYHYLAHVAGPAFSCFGAAFTIRLVEWGWYPRGMGEMQGTVTPVTSLQAASFAPGATLDVNGLAAVTNLPAHIPERMGQRAAKLLSEAGLQPHVDPLRAHGPAPGAGIFLWLARAGFSALGRPGLPAEQIAELAVAECLAFIENREAVDPFLADQLLMPAALAHGRSSFTTSTLTLHVQTCVSLLRQWLDIDIELDGRLGEPARLTINGCGFMA